MSIDTRITLGIGLLIPDDSEDPETRVIELNDMLGPDTGIRIENLYLSTIQGKAKGIVAYDSPSITEDDPLDSDNPLMIPMDNQTLDQVNTIRKTLQSRGIETGPVIAFLARHYT